MKIVLIIAALVAALFMSGCNSQATDINEFGPAYDVVLKGNTIATVIAKNGFYEGSAVGQGTGKKMHVSINKTTHVLSIQYPGEDARLLGPVQNVQTTGTETFLSLNGFVESSLPYYKL